MDAAGACKARDLEPVARRSYLRSHEPFPEAPPLVDVPALQLSLRAEYLAPVALVFWLLLTHVVTQIVTISTIAKPLRERLGGLPFGGALSCSMCCGWWVGLALSLLGERPAGLVAGWPFWAEALADAFAASAWTSAADLLLNYFAKPPALPLPLAEVW